MKTRHEQKRQTKQTFSNTFDMKIRILRNCSSNVGICMTKFQRNFCSRILFVRNFRMHLPHIIDMAIFQFKRKFFWMECLSQILQQSILCGGLVLHTAVHHCLESQYWFLKTDYFRDKKDILRDFLPTFRRVFFANFEIILPVILIFSPVFTDHRPLFRSLIFSFLQSVPDILDGTNLFLIENSEINYNNRPILYSDKWKRFLKCTIV